MARYKEPIPSSAPHVNRHQNTAKQMEKLLSVDHIPMSTVMGADGRTCESFPTVPASTHPLQLVISLN